MFHGQLDSLDNASLISLVERLRRHSRKVEKKLRRAENRLAAQQHVQRETRLREKLDKSGQHVVKKEPGSEEEVEKWSAVKLPASAKFRRGPVMSNLEICTPGMAATQQSDMRPSSGPDWRSPSDAQSARSPMTSGSQSPRRRISSSESSSEEEVLSLIHI